MKPSPATFDRAAAEEFLQSRINYEQNPNVAYRERNYKLDRMLELAARLGDPQRQYPIVHVAGTKGKGSTASMVASILSAAGFRTGLYLSPHLAHVEERISVAGEPCSSDFLAELLGPLVPIIEAMDREALLSDPADLGPTYFEITTVLAFLAFAKRQVDFAVLEVGLGGRLDSTNIVDPLVSIITSISFDHTKQLGPTLTHIAREKAGIIKPGRPIISGVCNEEPQREIERIAEERSARLWQLGRDFQATGEIVPSSSGDGPQRLITKLDFEEVGEPDSFLLPEVEVNLLGRHQADNAAVAIAAVRRLIEQGWSIPEETIRAGLKQVACPARIEVIGDRPWLVLDTAHNHASIQALLATLDEIFPGKPRRFVFGASKDKDVRSMLAQLLPRCEAMVLTGFANSRGHSAAALQEIADDVLRDMQTAQPARASPRVLVAANSLEAWRLARTDAAEDSVICVTGSFFLAGELQQVLVEEARAKRA